MPTFESLNQLRHFADKNDTVIASMLRTKVHPSIIKTHFFLELRVIGVFFGLPQLLTKTGGTLDKVPVHHRPLIEIFNNSLFRTHLQTISTLQMTSLAYFWTVEGSKTTVEWPMQTQREHPGQPFCCDVAALSSEPGQELNVNLELQLCFACKSDVLV